MYFAYVPQGLIIPGTSPAFQIHLYTCPFLKNNTLGSAEPAPIVVGGAN